MFYFHFDLVFNVNNILVNVDHFIKAKHYLQTLLLIKFTDTTTLFYNTLEANANTTRVYTSQEFKK